MIEARHFRPWEREVSTVLETAFRERVVARLWRKDFTLWKSEDREISGRLGWLTAPREAAAALGTWRRLAAEAKARGCTRVLLLGMGGSSLAPEVFSRIFGPAPGFPRLTVLDSTVPQSVRACREGLDPEQTLVIVSSKSGTTLETLCLFHYFFAWLEDRLGPEETGRRFVAVTDPGTPLETTARRRGFLDVVHGAADVGGRYSVFTAFGLLPASLLGLDLESLLRRGEDMALLCRNEDAPAENPGLILGVRLGLLAARGCDKLMLLMHPSLQSFGGWLEQLIAESTGKDGKGILPVLGERPAGHNLNGRDRLWAVFRIAGDDSLDECLERLDAAGRPCLVFDLEGPADLGGQFFLWEAATAVAGWCLGVNPFDQPDVAAAKKNTDSMLAAFRKLGRFPEENPRLREPGLSLYGEIQAASVAEAVRRFVSLGKAGDYIGLQAFLAQGPETETALNGMAEALRARTGLPVTVGFGPRYLHSTGQLHKGDAGKGLFLQISENDPQDLDLPAGAGHIAPEGSTFGTIKEAQALGDLQALRQAGRRVIRLRLENNAAAELSRLTDRLKD